MILYLFELFTAIAVLGLFNILLSHPTMGNMAAMRNFMISFNVIMGTLLGALFIVSLIPGVNAKCREGMVYRKNIDDNL